MEEEKFFYASVKGHPSIILMEGEVIDRSSWQRKTLREIRRLQADGGNVLAVILEIDLLPSSSHSKSLLDTLEGLPKTLSNLSWLSINGERESMVIHSYLTATDTRELIQCYRENKELSPIERVTLGETTDAQTVRLFLKQRAGKLKRE